MNSRLKRFTPEEHTTWKLLFERQEVKREQQIAEIFSKGLKILRISGERIPDLDQVNHTLIERTGFKGVPVEGLEGPSSFFKMLANREFPIGNFIRNSSDLSYTPAPDIFHDLYGHIPFFANEAYAECCQRIGKAASEFYEDPVRLRQFERLFWFTFEFGLLQTAHGLRIFGAGIVSSIGECNYALSGKPEVLAFNLNRIRSQEFRIDQMQPRLFVLESEGQLYSCLDEFIEKVRTSPIESIPTVESIYE